VSQLAHDNRYEASNPGGSKTRDVTFHHAGVAARLAHTRKLTIRDGHREDHYGAYGIGVEYVYTWCTAPRPQNSRSTRFPLAVAFNVNHPTGGSLLRPSQSI